jgi:2-oxo-3-hexenedioate decarboxylase
MVSRTSDWRDELGRWLKPFLDRLGHKARRQMCARRNTVIVNGLHGALLLAPGHPASFGSATDWVSNLAGFEIDLLRDGAVVDRGHSANVLNGPLSALRHLVALLARDPVNSPLATGDIVAAGTLTRAFPISPGESWSTTFHGIELGGRPVWFA